MWPDLKVAIVTKAPKKLSDIYIYINNGNGKNMIQFVFFRVIQIMRAYTESYSIVQSIDICMQK